MTRNMTKMSKKCDTCKNASTCPCPNCQRGICWEMEEHLSNLTDKEIEECECYEVDPDVVKETFKVASDLIFKKTHRNPIFSNEAGLEVLEKAADKRADRLFDKLCKQVAEEEVFALEAFLKDNILPKVCPDSLPKIHQYCSVANPFRHHYKFYCTCCGKDLGDFYFNAEIKGTTLETQTNEDSLKE